MDIYIGNLHRELREDALEKIFRIFGDIVKVTLVYDKETGLGKGFGFVAMANATEAKRAIAELDGRTLAGRRMVVREAGTATPKDEKALEWPVQETIQPQRSTKLNMHALADKPAKFSTTRTDDGLLTVKFK